MTATDPLAIERFRTILTDAIESVTPDDDEGFVDPEQLAEALLVTFPTFPDAHFEYRTNEAGVRLRRVVVKGTWEVDPLPAWMGGLTRDDTAPTEEAAPAAHFFIDTVSHGRPTGQCADLTMTSDHEGRICNLPADNPIHVVL